MRAHRPHSSTSAPGRTDNAYDHLSLSSTSTATATATAGHRHSTGPPTPPQLYTMSRPPARLAAYDFDSGAQDQLMAVGGSFSPSAGCYCDSNTAAASSPTASTASFSPSTSAGGGRRETSDMSSSSSSPSNASSWGTCPSSPFLFQTSVPLTAYPDSPGTGLPRFPPSVEGSSRAAPLDYPYLSPCALCSHHCLDCSQALQVHNQRQQLGTAIQLTQSSSAYPGDSSAFVPSDPTELLSPNSSLRQQRQPIRASHLYGGQDEAKTEAQVALGAHPCDQHLGQAEEKEGGARHARPAAEGDEYEEEDDNDDGQVDELASPSCERFKLPSNVSSEGPVSNGAPALLEVDVLNERSRELQRWLVRIKPLRINLLPEGQRREGAVHVLMTRMPRNLRAVTDFADSAELLARGCVQKLTRKRGREASDSEPYELFQVPEQPPGQPIICTSTFNRSLSPASPHDRDCPIPVPLTDKQLIAKVKAYGGAGQRGELLVVVTPPTRQAKLVEASASAGKYLVMHAPTPANSAFSYMVRIYGKRAADWKIKRVGLSWAAPIKGFDRPDDKRIHRWTVWTPSEECTSEGDGLDDYNREELDVARPSEEGDETEEEGTAEKEERAMEAEEEEEVKEEEEEQELEQR